MRKLFSLIALFVLTLGVAQAYSPPEEVNDLAPYELSVTEDHQAVIVDAPEVLQNSVSVIVTFNTYQFSNIDEDVYLAVSEVDADKDVGYTHSDQLTNKEIANSRSTSRQFIRKRNQASSIYIHGYDRALAVPWQLKLTY